MSQWKGPWRCDVCNRDLDPVRVGIVKGWHLGTDGQQCCGKLVPHDRRAPNPLLPLVKELREAIDSMVRVASRGHVPDDVFDAFARIRESAVSRADKAIEKEEGR